MKKIIFTLAGLGILVACERHEPVSSSSPLASGEPESVGLSAERLARIDSMCTRAIREGEVPGMVTLVARHGKIVFHKAFGMADYQADREMKKDDIFRIASQSKAITATAVMMLCEEGKFHLDDPIPGSRS